MHVFLEEIFCGMLMHLTRLSRFSRFCLWSSSGCCGNKASVAFALAPEQQDALFLVIARADCSHGLDVRPQAISMTE